MNGPRANSEYRLSWLNFFLAVLCFIPCCFPVQFPTLTGIISEQMHPVLPDDAQVTPWQILGKPFSLMYSLQLVLIGIPAFLAAIFLRRRSHYGWWLALVTLIDQSLFFMANTVALLLYGRFALLFLGSFVVLPLFALQLALLALHAFLISSASPS